MAELWVIKVDGVLHADGDESQAVMDKIPTGKPLQCDVVQKRSAKHLRLYFKICARIADALDRDGLDRGAVSDFFKRATGHYEIIDTQTFGQIVRLKSISFINMDQIAFREFFERCVRFAYLEWKIPADVFSDLLEDKGR